MKRKRSIYMLVFAICAISFAGCALKKSEKTEDSTPNLIGNAKDDHGCLTSAGYQWSELLKDCIRPFEKGVKLAGMEEKNSTMGAYLVFNADSSKVELFMPGEDTNLILPRTETSWKNHEFEVTHTNQTWSIVHKGREIFKK